MADNQFNELDAVKNIILFQATSLMGQGVDPLAIWMGLLGAAMVVGSGLLEGYSQGQRLGIIPPTELAEGVKRFRGVVQCGTDTTRDLLCDSASVLLGEMTRDQFYAKHPDMRVAEAKVQAKADAKATLSVEELQRMMRTRPGRA